MNKGESSGFEIPTAGALNRDIGDGYEIVALIGSGGMGAVYRGIHRELEREVAIKILPGNIDGLSERFKNEARVLAQCSHPNIVAVYDYGETRSGLPYLVMEHVSGGDLESRIESGEISDHETFAWLRQICDGLAYAHSRGMAHLDIKPSNLLIEGDDLKIADFGLARIVGLDTPSPGGGTPLYAAPELHRKSEGIDQRADIYSLGVIIYRMLTGKMPKGLWIPPSKANPELGQGFDRVAEFSLKKNPDNRYQNIVELESDLMEIFFSRPDTDSGSSLLQPRTLRTRLIYIFLSMFASQITGSAFNIWYNKKYIIENFFKDQPDKFFGIVGIYNVAAYVPLVSIWGCIVFSLLRMEPDSPRARSRAINLPWWAMGTAAVGWIGSIPGLWLPLRETGPGYLSQLSVSVAIGAALALTQGFLVVDLLSQNLLYSHFFSRREKPWNTPGAFPLSLRRRWVFWTIASGVCPVVALLLLVSREDRMFAGGVAAVCVAFGLVGAWLLGRIMVEPIDQLGEAANRVGSGDLRTGIKLLRADELGVLAYEFNQMVTGLREREFIRDTLGRTSGREGMENLLNRDRELNGSVHPVVVMAVRVHGYEAIVERSTPEESLQMIEDLEILHRSSVERFGGQLYQSLGGICTSVFGATPGHHKNTVNDAVKAADSLSRDWEPFAGKWDLPISIGIDVGDALTGTIASVRQRGIVVAGDVVSNAISLAKDETHGITISPACERHATVKIECRVVAP